MTNAYITLGSNDIERSRSYYGPVMDALGATMTMEIPDRALCYKMPDGFRIWVTKPYNEEEAAAGNGQTAGLYAADTKRVDAAYAAALSNGGSDEGAPGPRPLYGPEFYGGYARDPDGNKMSFITFRKDA